jgi:hypothetical protein
MANWYFKKAAAVNTGTGLAEWAANTAYAAGDRVVCTRAYATTDRRRFVYECTVPGTSHASTQPTWGNTVNGTQTDGSVTWTCRQPTTWANASLYLDYVISATASSYWAGGDRFWLASDYVCDITGDLTLGAANYQNAGLLDATTYITSTSDTVNEPPQSVSAGAKIRCTGSCAPILYSAYFWGIEFHVGQGAASGTPLFYSEPAAANGPGNVTYDQCLIKLAYASATGSRIYLGRHVTSYNGAANVHLINTNIEFTNASQRVAIGYGHLRVLSGAILGTAPTTLLEYATNVANGSAVFTGVDLSLVSGTLVDPGNYAGSVLTFSRCRLHSSVTPVAGYAPYHHAPITLELCDYGVANYKLYSTDHQGYVQQETTIIRSGGASDGVTPISWKMATNTYAHFLGPLATPWVATWVDSVGDGLTVQMEALLDANSSLLDREVWMETVVMATSGTPMGSFARTNTLGVFSGTNVATSAAEWVTTGLTNPFKHKFTQIVTPMIKGLVTARICVAKDKLNLYVDPKIQVS